MSKKSKQKVQKKEPLVLEDRAGLLKKKAGKKLFITGVIILAAGLFVLSRANRMADNWAGYMAPVLIISAWVVIAVGLWKIED